jgi:hypothetical protein
MKRTLLALAIASATYSLPTVAAEEEMLSEGVRLQTIDKAHSVAKIPLNERTWSFSGVPVDVDLSDIEMTGDPREIARAAILKIRHLG